MQYLMNHEHHEVRMRFSTTASFGIVFMMVGLSYGVVTSGSAQNSEAAVFHTSYALNWAGYTSYTSATNPQPAITKVIGSWTQPSVKPSKTAMYSSFWVGIGGFFSGDNSLIQTGTDSDTSNNKVSYYAWYEMLPAASVTITCLTIKPGDHITAYVLNAGTNSWVIDIATDGAGGGSGTCTNTANPKEFQQTFSYSSSMKSAEWVVERPSLCFVTCQITKLANFGTVTFYDAAYVASGVTYTISGAGFGTYDVVLMVSKNSKILCDVQPRTNPGSTFNGIWKASS